MIHKSWESCFGSNRMKTQASKMTAVLTDKNVKWGLILALCVCGLYKDHSGSTSAPVHRNESCTPVLWQWFDYFPRGNLTFLLHFSGQFCFCLSSDKLHGRVLSECLFSEIAPIWESSKQHLSLLQFNASVEEKHEMPLAVSGSICQQ